MIQEKQEKLAKALRENLKKRRMQKIEQQKLITDNRKTVTILGSTGSIGNNTLSVIEQHSNLFEIFALTAQNNTDLLIKQALKFRPKHVVIGDANQYDKLCRALSSYNIQVHSGEKAIIEIASVAADITVSAIVGIAGLKPTYEALRNGKTVALANKESLVAAGDIIMDQAKNFGAELLPIDSEHSAILQVFEENNRQNIESIILTASGGPFWRNSLHELSSVTPSMAIKHPNWSMGTKISIDSATLMNKGLELIEAHYLFNLPTNKIEVVIHPQSIVHSLVRYSDGSLLAQLGEPDMRTAIACALSWPNRLHINVKRLSLTDIGKLEFFPLDEERFPSIRLARLALENQQSVIYNAANEVAVSKFIAGQIKFLDITTLVEKTLTAIPSKKANDLDEVFYMHQYVVQYINTLFP